MTDLLDHAVDALRALPAGRRDELARLVLDLAEGSGAAYRLTAEEHADLDAADVEIARGELASDEEVRSVWAKRGL